MIPFVYITLPTYSIFATIGGMAVVVFLFFRMDRFGFTFGKLITYILAGLIGLIIGSKLLYAIGAIPTMETVTLEAFLNNILYGGIVFYGGMLGAILGVFTLCKIRKENVRNVMNYGVPSFPLFHFFGRLGCLFGGCCYGIRWNWGVIMADSPEVCRFPVQLIEALCNAGIFASLLVIEHRKIEINMMRVYLISYAVCRFVLEFFRGDIIRGVWFGLSTSQIISCVILIVCCATIIAGKVMNRKRDNDINDEQTGDIESIQ